MSIDRYWRAFVIGKYQDILVEIIQTSIKDFFVQTTNTFVTFTSSD